MTRPAPLSRRTALAGAAFLVGNLTSSVTRAGESTDGTCCGKGPPQCRLYGTGIHPIPSESCENAVEFDNPFWGDAGDLGQWYYVFVPETRVEVTKYVDSQGVTHKPKHYFVPEYSGIIFRIEPGFILGLLWPDGVTPDYSTRPLGKQEGGNT